MSTYEVTLVGEWTRPLTSEYDIRQYRRRLSVLGAARGIAFEKIHAYRRAPGLDRHGQFVVKIAGVPAPPYRTRTKAISRATQILRWFLEDYTCRPPVIKVDRRSATVKREVAA